MPLPRSASRRAALASALLLALSSTAAFAVDPQCRDADGHVILPAPSTNQGVEAGVDNATCHAYAVAVGGKNIAGDRNSVAVGYYNWALGEESVAFGYSATAMGEASTAVGRANWAFGFRSQAYGGSTVAAGDSSVAFGTWFDRNNDGFVNIDLDLDGDGVMDSSSEGTFARGKYATALGAGADAVADNSVAIGSGSLADRGNAVSFGNASVQRQLINVADGTQDFDAVNLRQLRAAIAGSSADLSPFAAAFGGGAAWAGGIFTPPSYTIQGVSYNNVGAALAAIDSWMSGNANGVQYDDASHATVTLDGANGTQVKNVAAGTAATDAVNKQQMDAGDAATLTASKSYSDTKSSQTLASAKTYTDQKFAAWNDTFTQYQQQVDRRFAQTDKRIDQIGAMGSAMTHMAVNAANGNSAKGRIAIGVGAQGSQGAVSIGYGKRLGDRGSFSLGASFASGEASAGAGFGFDL